MAQKLARHGAAVGQLDGLAVTLGAHQSLLLLLYRRDLTSDLQPSHPAPRFPSTQAAGRVPGTCG